MLFAANCLVNAGFQQELPDVTYVGVLTRNEVTANNSIEKLLRIGYMTSRHVNFAEKVIYSAQKVECETYDFKVVKIDSVPFDHYTGWVLKNFQHLFTTPYMINFHADGMIQNPASWTNDFLKYDYVGAPWPDDFQTGNGGFTLRSKRLCQLAGQIDVSHHVPQKGIEDNEDVLICRKYRQYFIDAGCQFAPPELAARFSTEHYSPDKKMFHRSFGFHEIEKLWDENLKVHRRIYLDSLLAAL
jgi:hypothetical protein